MKRIRILSTGVFRFSIYRAHKSVLTIGGAIISGVDSGPAGPAGQD